MSNEKSIDKEYSRNTVPLSQRKPFHNLLVIWFGLVFVVTSMQIGGIIGNGLRFDHAIYATLMSSVILAVIGSFMGVMASKTGLTFGLLSKYSFGEMGTWIPTVIVVVTTIGWFSIDAWLIGSSTNTLFSNIPIIPIAILGGIGMVITALYGIDWMTKLSNIAVPLIAIFAIISMVIAFKDVGGVTGFMNIVPKEPITFSHGVSLGVGSFAVGAVMFTPDVLRFAKSQKSAIWIMTIAMVIGNSFVVLFGVIGSIATGDSDIANILAIQGLLAPAFLVLVLNIWSTAQGCVYSGSLSLSSSIKNLSREKIVIGFGVIGIVLAILGFYNYFGTYINFLASLVPTLSGVFISDFLFKYKSGYPSIEETKFSKVDYTGFVSWIIGIFVCFLIPVGFPTINGVLASFIARTIFTKAVR